MLPHRPSILLLKLGDLGDVIQAAHSLFALKKSGLEVKLLTSKSYAGCLPDRDIVCCVPPDFIKRTKSDKLGVAEPAFRERICRLIKNPNQRDPRWGMFAWLTKFHDFNVVVDLDGFPASMVLVARLRQQYSMKTLGWRGRTDYYKHAKIEIYQQLLPSVYTESFSFCRYREMHGIARYCSLLEEAKLLSSDCCARHLPIFSYRRGRHIRFHKRQIAVHLVTSKAGKNWPVDRFAELIKNISARLQGRSTIVLLGDRGSDDEWSAAREFVGLLNSHKKTAIRNLLAERKNYSDQAAILQDSDLLIGGDSSWGHMAAALGVRTFTIFGVGAEPTVYRPWADETQAEIRPKEATQAAETISLSDVISRIRPLIKRLKL